MGDFETIEVAADVSEIHNGMTVRGSNKMKFYTGSVKYDILSQMRSFVPGGCIQTIVRICLHLFFFSHYHLGLAARKPVFGVSNKVRFKPVFSAIEISKKIEILRVASLDIILSNKRITKTLIRLCGCAGWSAPLLFANPRRKVFSRLGPFENLVNHKIYSYAVSFKTMSILK